MFKTVFSFESGRFITWRNFKIFLAFFLLLVGLSYDGIRDYKANIEGIESFQETERQKGVPIHELYFIWNQGNQVVIHPKSFLCDF